MNLIQGDCIEVLAKLDADSIDSIVTDPPYGLEFMGKDWDKLATSGRDGLRHRRRMDKAPATEAGNPWASERKSYGHVKKNPRCKRCSKLRFDHEPRRCSCGTPDWDLRLAESGRAMQAWHESWAVEALRVLKPGAHLLAFGGTRTYHRLVVALEDAGFEIRDCIAWMYGTGFPKSLDVSKAIDKAAPRAEMFDGFAAHFREQRKASGLSQKEVAVHFPSKTGGLTGCVWNWENGANVPTRQQWNVLAPMLALSKEWLPLIERVEAGREVVGMDRNWGPASKSTPNAPNGEWDITAPATTEAQQWQGWGTALKPAFEPIVVARKPLSEKTVAANVQRWGTGALNIDGTRIATDDHIENHGRNPTHNGWDPRMSGGQEQGQTPGQALGRWPANVALDEDAAAMLDEQSGDRLPGRPQNHFTPSDKFAGVAYGDGLSLQTGRYEGYTDTGGASRFFYVAKASRKERGEGNDHPTVKPVALMQWLVRLVTPPGGRVLDPFTGSGTTGLAAMLEGFEFVGIERDAHYCEIARARLADLPDEPMQETLLG